MHTKKGKEEETSSHKRKSDDEEKKSGQETNKTQDTDTSTHRTHRSVHRNVSFFFRTMQNRVTKEGGSPPECKQPKRSGTNRSEENKKDK